MVKFFSYRGFTLIELGLIVALMALLSIVTVPRYTSYKSFSTPTVASNSAEISVSNEKVMACPKCGEGLVITRTEAFSPITCNKCQNVTPAIFPETIQIYKQKMDESSFWPWFLNSIVLIFVFILGKLWDFISSFVASVFANAFTKKITPEESPGGNQEIKTPPG